jgi:hypothetical protein
MHRQVSGRASHRPPDRFIGGSRGLGRSGHHLLIAVIVGNLKRPLVSSKPATNMMLFHVGAGVTAVTLFMTVNHHCQTIRR